MSKATRLKAVVEMTSSVLLVGIAVAMMSLYIHERATGGVISKYLVLDTIDNWREENAGGILMMGRQSAPVVISEFMDFQCPYCAALVPRVDSVHAELPDDVAVVFQHYPLGGRPIATAAAVAAECAGRQGVFNEMARALFAEQQSLGIRPWAELARHAGVPSLTAFDDCIGLPPESFPRIVFGRQLGAKTGVTGTPTVWVNGRVVQPRTVAALRAAVLDALDEHWE